MDLGPGDFGPDGHQHDDAETPDALASDGLASDGLVAGELASDELNGGGAADPDDPWWSDPDELATDPSYESDQPGPYDGGFDTDDGGFDTDGAPYDGAQYDGGFEADGPYDADLEPESGPELLDADITGEASHTGPWWPEPGIGAEPGLPVDMSGIDLDAATDLDTAAGWPPELSDLDVPATADGLPWIDVHLLAVDGAEDTTGGDLVEPAADPTDLLNDLLSGAGRTDGGWADLSDPDDPVTSALAAWWAPGAAAA